MPRAKADQLLDIGLQSLRTRFLLGSNGGGEEQRGGASEQGNFDHAQ